MKVFEIGKEYKVNGPGCIRIEKRTKHFVTFSGDYSGRKKLDSGLFGMGEYFMIPTPDCKNFQYFCFADHIKK